jgi:hypothetical protein
MSQAASPSSAVTISQPGWLSCATANSRMIGSSSTASSRSGWSKTYRSPSRVCASSMWGRDSVEAPTGAHNVSATGKRARLGESKAARVRRGQDAATHGPYPQLPALDQFQARPACIDRGRDRACARCRARRLARDRPLHRLEARGAACRSASVRRRKLARACQWRRERRPAGDARRRQGAGRGVRDGRGPHRRAGRRPRLGGAPRRRPQPRRRPGGLALAPAVEPDRPGLDPGRRCRRARRPLHRRQRHERPVRPLPRPAAHLGHRRCARDGDRPHDLVPAAAFDHGSARGAHPHQSARATTTVPPSRSRATTRSVSWRRASTA